MKQQRSHDLLKVRESAANQKQNRECIIVRCSGQIHRYAYIINKFSSPEGSLIFNNIAAVTLVTEVS